MSRVSPARTSFTGKVVVGTTAAVVAGAGIVGTAFAGDNNGPGMMRYGRDRGHPGLFLLCLVAIAALAILGTWLIIRRQPQVAAASVAAPMVAVAPTASAEAILAERLARSEITPDDYRATLAALRDAGGAATPQPPTPG